MPNDQPEHDAKQLSGNQPCRDIFGLDIRQWFAMSGDCMVLIERGEIMQVGFCKMEIAG